MGPKEKRRRSKLSLHKLFYRDEMGACGSRFGTLNSLFETRFQSENGIISAPVDRGAYNEVLMTRFPMTFWSHFEYRDGTMYLHHPARILKWVNYATPDALERPHQPVPTQVELLIKLLSVYAPHLSYDWYQDLTDRKMVIYFNGDLKHKSFPEPIEITYKGILVPHTAVDSLIETLSQP